MRGEVHLRDESARRHGIIPAGAGRRDEAKRAKGADEDHPRGCGEKTSARAASRRLMGSSPRVRGEGSASPLQTVEGGIIPAGAGRSRPRLRKTRRRRDHPRGCGEKCSSVAAKASRWGSSPRVRGEDRATNISTYSIGIIPAGAGRSSIGVYAAIEDRDHPRGCGEKPSRRPPARRRKGSSPRVRGEVGDGVALHIGNGIIPAGAGRSCSTTTSSRCGRDHPRGCGEKTNARWIPARRMGSSPRVRGEAGKGSGGRPVGGIIPAGAGRSRPLRAHHPLERDHPRGCGEKKKRFQRLIVDVGSSPRVRGEDLVRPRRAR